MPTMIYNANNQYAIVDDGEAAAYIAGGWYAAPQGDIYSEPTRFAGDMTIPSPSKKKATAA